MDRNLVPELILNIGDRFSNEKTSVNEKFNLKMRLESVREYVDEILKQNDPNGLWNNNQKRK